jgi:hypothetical protein
VRAALVGNERDRGVEALGDAIGECENDDVAVERDELASAEGADADDDDDEAVVVGDCRSPSYDLECSTSLSTLLTMSW